MKRNDNLNKDIIKCYDLRTFKAYIKAFNDCKMVGELKQVERITPIRKAKQLVVEYAGDSWSKDAQTVGEILMNIA